LLRAVEADPLIGTRLADRYEIDSVIGRGGMGVVYKAHQELMDRMMAIKMLHSHMVSEPESVKRFYREAKTVSQVRHHNIITLYDFGMSAKGQPYIVMDYLEGTSLKQLIKDMGSLPFERADRIFKQVVDALAAAHGLNVVHRDLKPENIMLTKQNNEQDWVTLVDFGLSKLKDLKVQDNNFRITRGGDVCGSPPYMSPEQCLSSLVVDPRSDIYSLAVVIYESLSGRLPFDVKSAIEMIDRHLYSTPIPLNAVSPGLKVCTETARVLTKALEKAPEKRHQTIEEFGLDLHEAMTRDSIKLRALRHRVEVLSLQGTKDNIYSAENMPPNPSDLKNIAVVTDGAQFWMQQADMEQDLQTNSGQDAKGSSANEQSDGDINQLYFCPYCDAPLNKNFKFCLQCQRTFKPNQAKIKSRKRSPRKSASDFSIRSAKMQELLRLVVIGATAYGLYVGITSGLLFTSLKNMAHRLHVEMPID
jgi:serine/threonine protein kinase